MKRLILIVMAVPIIAAAKQLPCSIKAARFDADTKAQAKVTENAARDTALGRVKAAGATIAGGGLEVEDGCLLYTYDVKIPGRPGVQEVIIDAGSGKVLKVEQESAAREAAEKVKDKMVPKKP